MAASLSSRSALVMRSTSISTGAIVGATIGSVLGAALIVICVLPFIFRARRRAACRRDGELGPEIGELPGVSSFSHHHFGGAFRHMSRSHCAPASGSGSDNTTSTPIKDFDAEGSPESSVQNGNSLTKPQQSPSRPEVDTQHGLPTPISPPLPAVASFPPPSRAPTADSQTMVRSPTAQTEASLPISPTSVSNQRSTDSYTTQPQQVTALIHEGITEEPESMTRDVGPGIPSRRRSSHLSDSVRRLARRASAAVRRASGASDGERSEKALRSPSIGPGEALPTTSVIEPVDTEARGEAYSYYHDVDAPPLGSYAPPLSILTTNAVQPPQHSGTFASPTQLSTATPMTPVSPGSKPGVDSPAGYGLAHRPTFGLDKGMRDLPDPRSSTGTSRKKKGFPEPLQRMDSLPPQAIMSDIPSPPLVSRSEPSVNPMDIMKPSTETEMGWMVTQELVKMSSSPSPVPNQTAEFVGEPMGQPTPDLTPEPELMPPPEIEINGHDLKMEDAPIRPTPPPSSAISNETTPGNTPDTRSSPFTSTPSPGSHDASSDKPDSSPRQFPCEECHRVFDQFHKLK